MSKAAGGSESASKGPRRRQPRRGPGKLDVFEPDDYAPGGFKNTFPGDPRESKRARSTGKKSLAEDVEQAAPQVLASVEAVLREYKVCAYLSIDKSLNKDEQIARALPLFFSALISCKTWTATTSTSLSLVAGGSNQHMRIGARSPTRWCRASWNKLSPHTQPPHRRAVGLRALREYQNSAVDAE